MRRIHRLDKAWAIGPRALESKTAPLLIFAGSVHPSLKIVAMMISEV